MAAPICELAYWNAPGRLAETTPLSDQWCKTPQHSGAVKTPAADAVKIRGSGSTSWCKESLLLQYFFRSFPTLPLTRLHSYQNIWLARPVVSRFLPLISGGSKPTIVAWYQLIPTVAAFLNYIDIYYSMHQTSRLCRISIMMLLCARLLLEYIANYCQMCQSRHI